MRIISCKVGHLATLSEIYKNLRFMQNFVGGNIETVASPSGYVLICNEEGLLKDLPINPVMEFYHSIMMNWPDFIHGNYFITYRKDDDFTDIPDNDETIELLRLLNLERSSR